MASMMARFILHLSQTKIPIDALPSVFRKRGMAYLVYTEMFGAK